MFRFSNDKYKLYVNENVIYTSQQKFHLLWPSHKPPQVLLCTSCIGESNSVSRQQKKYTIHHESSRANGHDEARIAQTTIVYTKSRNQSASHHISIVEGRTPERKRTPGYGGGAGCAPGGSGHLQRADQGAGGAERAPPPRAGIRPRRRPAASSRGETMTMTPAALHCGHAGYGRPLGFWP